jgi:hypothetical protein
VEDSSVADNEPASPQKVVLLGIGTAVQLTPISLGFGNQPTGTTSLAKTITLSNKSHAMLNIQALRSPEQTPAISARRTRAERACRQVRVVSSR